MGRQLLISVRSLKCKRGLDLSTGLLLLLYVRLKGLSRCKDVAKDRNAKGTSSMDCRERGFHAQGLYPTQDTSRMGTVRVKEEEGADTGIIVKE